MLKRQGLFFFVMLYALLSTHGNSNPHAEGTPPQNHKISMYDSVHFNEHSYVENISANGRYIVFSSLADNHGTPDTNQKTDIFWYDRLTEELILVSKNISGTATGNAASRFADISDDGKFVVFLSYATDLAENDTLHCIQPFGCYETFLWSRQTDEVTKISVTWDGQQSDGESGTVSISADGSKVVFSSTSNKLTNDDNDACSDGNCPDLFLYDNSLPGNHIIKLGNTYDGSEIRYVYNQAEISGDGNLVVFASGEDSFLPGDTNLCNHGGYMVSCYDIFLLNLDNSTISLVSKSENGDWGNEDSLRPQISFDGSTIAFQSDADNLVSGDTNNKPDAFIFDTNNEILRRISNSQGNIGAYLDVHLSSSGDFMTFLTNTDDIQPPLAFYQRIRIYDVNQNIYFSAPYTYDGSDLNASQNAPHISDDGRFLYFASQATNLVENDPDNQRQDIYLYDREVTVAPTIPFLNIPVTYSGDPEQVLLGNFGSSGGRVNSWFDHDEPRWQHNFNQEMLPWHGLILADLSGTPCTFGINCYDTHDGIDFQKLSTSDMVVSAASGDVIKIGGLYLGNSVMIDHGNGYATVYGHLDWIHPEWVEASPTNPIPISQGQEIGEIGATGCPGCGEHLHFEVRFDPDGVFPITSKVDPFGWAGIGPDPAYSKGYVASPRRGLWMWSQSTMDQQVGPSGGQISGPYGNMNINIPSGALSFVSNWNFTLLPGFWNSTGYLSTPWNFWFYPQQGAGQQLYARDVTNQPESGEFSIPATITIEYSDSDIVGLNENTLVIGEYDETTFTLNPIPSTLDVSNNVVSAETLNAGRFGLIGLPLCPNDVGEFDNNDAYAQSFVIGEATSKIFSTDGDVDWMNTAVITGTAYVLEITNLSNGAEPMVTVTDGHQDLVSGLGTGQLTFLATTNEIYVKAESQSVVNGCGTGYTVTLKQDTQSQGFELFLPILIR